MSDRWKAVRTEILGSGNGCCALCGFRPKHWNLLHLDHLVGHRDDIAQDAAFCMQMTIKPTWQERFYEGPFLPLCEICHNAKTGKEAAGKLLDWMQANWDVLKTLRPTV